VPAPNPDDSNRSEQPHRSDDLDALVENVILAYSLADDARTQGDLEEWRRRAEIAWQAEEDAKSAISAADDEELRHKAEAKLQQFLMLRAVRQNFRT
jgi:hypothetical protein